MLASVECQNFRCLEKVEVPLAPLTALVGPNGAGKSAVLRAIDLVAGPVWPSLQRIRFPHDFTMFDDSRHLRIEVKYATPIASEKDKLGTQYPIHGLRVSCKPYKRRTGASVAGDPNFDYEPIDAVGDVPLACIAAQGQRPTMQRPHRVTTPLRDHGACVLIDHRRAVAQHQPGTRGSVLGRLLAPALRELDVELDDGEGGTRRDRFRDRFAHAADVLRTPYVSDIEQIVDETARRTLGFMGSSAAARGGRVSFQIADPVNPYASLRIVYTEDGLAFPAEEVGLGVQSAIVVGIFEAMRGRRTAAGTVLIDEPEMYLHPQAQRHFYDILVGLVEQGGTQVIYSTHSPVFADAARFEGLRLIRRPPGASSNVAFVQKVDRPALETSKAATKLLTEYDSARSEALFANAVLLVEGKADLIAVRGTAERMKLDLDARNLSVMECGGKTSIPFHARLCRALGIPVCALYDDDQWPVTDDLSAEGKKRLEAELARSRRESADIESALPDKSLRFVCSPTLEDLVGIGRTAKNKPLRMAEKIKAAARREDLPEQLVAAVQRLDELDRARVKATVTKSSAEVAPATGGSGS